jgi:hypothetical protein
MERNYFLVTSSSRISAFAVSAGIGTCDFLWLPRFLRAGPSTSLDENFKFYLTMKT